MYRTAASIFLFLFTEPAIAETCPDFFRFVDFGLQGDDGTVNRRGSLFRAESFEGEMLLEFGRTECLPVQDVAKDGRGNPIPIVRNIYYQPRMIATELTELGVRFTEDTIDAAENNAKSHRTRLQQSDTIVTRGSNYLCISNKENSSTSCQVVSPFQENIALVIYCDALQCNMPVMAIDNQISVNANWLRTPDSVGKNDLIGPEVVDRTEQLHEFLLPISSLKPGG